MSYHPCKKNSYHVLYMDQLLSFKLPRETRAKLKTAILKYDKGAPTSRQMHKQTGISIKALQAWFVNFRLCVQSLDRDRYLADVDKDDHVRYFL